MLNKKFKDVISSVTQKGVFHHYEPLLKKQLELTNFILIFSAPIIFACFLLLKSSTVNYAIFSSIAIAFSIAFYSNIRGKTFSRIILSCIFPCIAFLIPFSMKWLNNPIEQYFPAFFNIRAILIIGVGLTLILLNYKTERWAVLGITIPTFFLFIFFKPYYEFALDTSLDEISLYPIASLSPTMGAYIGFVLMLIFQIYVNKKFENQLIKQKDQIHIQNEEILTQNEELRQSQEEVLSQRDYIIEQHQVLKEKSTRLTDSIRYAKSIQQSILPGTKELNTILSNYFVIYRPKDIVSGDFFWVHQTSNQKALVLADCTGHGVPGAFMSMLGISILNEIFEKKYNLPPHEILELLDIRITKALNQENNNGNHDGMDIALCLWKTDNDDKLIEFQYTGAKQPLYYVQDGALTYLKGTKRSIGGYYNQKKIFETHHLKLKQGTKIYLSSDGYIDQNKENSTKRIGTKKLQELLVSSATDSLLQQKKILEDFLDAHQKSDEQRDDITLFGFML